jgi:hypothetical protein
MAHRLGRVALSGLRAQLVRQAPRPATASFAKATVCQVRPLTGSSVRQEQYLHGYKDSERYHGNSSHFFVTMPTKLF